MVHHTDQVVLSLCWISKSLCQIRRIQHSIHKRTHTHAHALTSIHSHTLTHSFILTQICIPIQILKPHPHQHQHQYSHPTPQPIQSQMQPTVSSRCGGLCSSCLAVNSARSSSKSKSTAVVTFLKSSSVLFRFNWIYVQSSLYFAHVVVVGRCKVAYSGCWLRVACKRFMFLM
jgi:hypothetical protein